MSAHHRIAELEDGQDRLRQQLRVSEVELSSATVSLEVAALPDSTIKNKYQDLQRQHEGLRTEYSEQEAQLRKLQQQAQVWKGANSTLQEQTGDLTKTLSQIHTCLEHAINQCHSVLAARLDSDQTVPQLRSQVSKVAASLKPAAARAAMRLRTAGLQRSSVTSQGSSQASPPRSRYRSPRHELGQSPTGRHPVVRRSQLTTDGSPTRTPATPSLLERRSPVQRRLLRSPDRAPLIEFTVRPVRGGGILAPLGITFGYREGTSHGLLEIKEIQPNTAAAQRAGKFARLVI